jgi:phosphatidylglycerol:prolipoprotein diacylglycerol transferase
MNEVFYINTSPIIFQIGPIKVGWYGVMVALAVIVVIAWGVWQNRKTHAIKSDSILGAAAVAIPTALIVSKLIHVIDQWDYYIHNPGRIISGEGLTIWGAVLGATLGAWLYSKISKQFRFTAFGDMLAPGIILAQAIGRVGCTFNGCCYGIESNSSFSIVYTNPNSYGPLGIPCCPPRFLKYSTTLSFSAFYWP